MDITQTAPRVLHSPVAFLVERSCGLSHDEYGCAKYTLTPYASSSLSRSNSGPLSAVMVLNTFEKCSSPYSSITREVALAQFKRADNGDYVKNAHWHDVYYYSSSGFYTVASAQYVLTLWQGMIPSDSSMPRYQIGDDQHDKSKVTITPQSNYSAEYVDIVLNP